MENVVESISNVQILQLTSSSIFAQGPTLDVLQGCEYVADYMWVKRI